MAFNPNNPFKDEEVTAPPPDLRQQLLASLQARMAPVPQPDVTAQEAAAKQDRDQSNLVRSGVQLGHALLGNAKSDGDNLYSQSLEGDAKDQLAKAMEAKRIAAEQDKRREELRNGLSTRFVDDENLRARSAEERKHKEADYGRDRKDKVADQEALFRQQKELAAMNHKDGASSKAEAKQALENDKSQQKLAKDLASPQALDSAIQDVEGIIGGPLTSFSRKGSDMFRDGQKVDLPGVETGIPGIGNVSFYNDRARALDAAMSSVFNMTLKDRSGAAVTDQELARLKQEFNDGKFTTEADKIEALQRYQRKVKEVMGNREAGYNKDVVDDYANRGGRVSGAMNAVPRMLTPPPIPPKGPQAGHEEDGFVFQGGDPQDKNNWKKK